MTAASLLVKLRDRFAQVERGALQAFPRNESDEGAIEGGTVSLAAAVAIHAEDAQEAGLDARASSPRKMAVLLAVGALVSKVLGFAREILMAQVLGASLIADGYRGAITALALPLVFLQNESVPAILIPMHQAAQRRGDARAHLVSMSCAMSLIAAMLMFAVQTFADDWVGALLGGFGEDGKRITLDYLAVMSWAMPASTLLNVLAAGEIAEGQTRISNLRASLLNLSMILGLVLYYASGWFGALGWSFMAAFNGLALWSLWVHHREGKFDYSGLRPERIADAMRDFLRRLRPVVGLPLAEQCNVWVERIAASHVMTGAVASLDYARTLSETALLLISQPIGLAFMSSYKEGESHRQIEGIVRLILALTGPASAFVFIFAPDIVRLVFYRGVFSESGLLLTSSALRGVSVGLWASTLGWILLRQLNSDGRNALATSIVVAGYVANIGVNGAAAWVGSHLGPNLLIVGLGETVRSVVLLVGTIMALPDPRRIFSLIPVAAVPALLMLLGGFWIQAEIATNLARLALGGLACLACTVAAGYVLVPNARDICAAGLAKFALGGK
jgi:putative peptidoglycan lipid II flippase